jgi:phosphoglycolate phosphatase
MHLFFDLDGTLTDSALGITRSIQFALERLGRPVPPADELRRFLGPPLRVTFDELLTPHEAGEIDEAVRLYRERFVPTGMFENEVYPGVREALSRLLPADRLYVVTSKPRVYARKIVEHFDLARFFAAVHGSELSGLHDDKGDLIAHVLQAESVPKAEAWMIGDRRNDVLGARRNGLVSVGVLWGYGSAAELQEAGPTHLVSTTSELVGLVEGARAGGLTIET